MNTFFEIGQQLKRHHDAYLQIRRKQLMSTLQESKDFSFENSLRAQCDTQYKSLKDALEPSEQRFAEEGGELIEKIDGLSSIMIISDLITQGIQQLLEDLKAKKELSLIRNEIAQLNDSLDLLKQILTPFNILIKKGISAETENEDLLKKELTAILVEQKELQRCILGERSYQSVLGYSALAGLVAGALGSGLTLGLAFSIC